MSDDPQKNSSDRENRIRERAYHLWEADGRPEGREQVYWEHAEAMISKEESEEQRGAPEERTIVTAWIISDRCSPLLGAVVGEPE